MNWVLAGLVVLVVAGVVAVAAGRGGGYPEADHDGPDALPALPEGDLGADEIRAVRLPLALRGYRMKDVDALLARLADEAAARHSGPPAGGAAGDGHEGP